MAKVALKMKTTRNYLFQLFIIFLWLSFSIKAQQPVALPEIKGSYLQEYEGLKIEIIGVDRVKEYQMYYPKTQVPRLPKFVAEPGNEIAVVHIRTERLGMKPGVGIAALLLRDTQGHEYESSIHSSSIGSGSERSLNDPKIHDYEFPVEVPKGIWLSEVQLVHHIYRDESPQWMVQKLTFNLSLLINDGYKLRIQN